MYFCSYFGFVGFFLISLFVWVFCLVLLFCVWFCLVFDEQVVLRLKYLLLMFVHLLLLLCLLLF